MWLQRSNGQFWPSVHQTMLADVSFLALHAETCRLFVGTGLGTILVSCWRASVSLTRRCRSTSFLQTTMQQHMNAP
jgi:hypothetical protein